MKIAFIILVLLIIIYLLTTYIMFILISRKFNNYPIKTISNNITEALKPYKTLTDKGTKWVSKQSKEDIYIKSFDNLKLHALLIEKKQPKGIFIEVHGYRSVASRDIYPSCYHYYNMGYSLLIIDQRTSNKSEGKYLTFGINESKDIISWIEYINSRFPNLDIVLAGVSMGASTVMLSADKIKPNMNVKAILADCGYISPAEEIKYSIKHYFHINANLFIHMINIWSILLAKANLYSLNTINTLKNTKVPLLLIHGEDDDFVPPSNSIKNYESYEGKIKKIVLFKNTPHGMSYLVDPKKYVESIKNTL